MSYDPAPERPLERKRSLSTGAGRKSLTINTAFTVTSNRRLKRLVLGPGQNYPGGDNVQLVPDMADAADPKIYQTAPKGKRITQKDANRETMPKPKKEKHLVRRKPKQHTAEMLLHVNAECGYDDSRAPPLEHRTIMRDRQERLTTERETVLNRNGTEPIGLTIDENLTVTNVVPDTPAAKAGLIAGVRLSSVNGAYVYSQSDAIDALRACGQDVAIGLMSDTTAASLKHDKVVAGKTTAFAAADIRGKRPVPNNPETLRSGPPFGTSTAPPPMFGASSDASVRRHPGIGPPGIGPQPVAWGDYGPQDDGSIGGCPSPIQTTDDPFKPNLYIPHLLTAKNRSQSSPVASRRSGGQGNKTSYQLAVDKGETDTDGQWDRNAAAAKLGKQQMSVHRQMIEKQNGDIITNVEQQVYTPRRSQRDRAASPIPNRRPATGAPGVNDFEGEKYASSTGRQHFVVSDNATLLLEGHLPEDADSARRHNNMRGLRTLTPGRYRHTPNGHGDIVGHTHGRQVLPSPRGLRRAQIIDEPPRPVQKPFVPTPRHQVATPSHTDIFNIGADRGECKDTNDMNRLQRNKNIVGLSPRHASSVEMSHKLQSPDGACTPRRGRGPGAMAPPHAHSEYTPWGSRD